MIFLQKDCREPLYEQVFSLLKQQIISGELKEQERLPATRKLATELQVSRNTIEQAYSQLRAEGYVNSRQGSGYYVNPIDFSFSIPKYDFSASDVSDALLVMSEDVQQQIENSSWQKNCLYNLEYGAIHKDSFPLKVWRNMLNQAVSYAPEALHITYGERDGLWCLREEIARYSCRLRGLHCTAEQVIVGSSTQSLIQIAAGLMQEACGIDCIAMEDPGFQVARNVFQLQHYAVKPIAVQEDGIDLIQLEQTMARAVYITPSHQFPTGAILPVQKRLQLLRWAKERNGYILEDDYDSELRYASMPIPALQGLCENDTVIYFGTTSKAFVPTLRLAYMVLPVKLLHMYRVLFRYYNSSVSELQQYAFFRFMKEGYWERHLRKIVTQNKRKHDMFVRLLEEKLGDSFAIKGKGGGMHLLLESLDDRTERALMERARSAGVGVYPVSPYWMRKPEGNAQIMLGFSSLQLNQMEDVTTRLQHAFCHVT